LRRRRSSIGPFQGVIAWCNSKGIDVSEIFRRGASGVSPKNPNQKVNQDHAKIEKARWKALLSRKACIAVNDSQMIVATTTAVPIHVVA
jgi:hypothetical protein